MRLVRAALVAVVMMRAPDPPISRQKGKGAPHARSAGKRMLRMGHLSIWCTEREVGKGTESGRDVEEGKKNVLELVGSVTPPVSSLLVRVSQLKCLLV